MTADVRKEGMRGREREVGMSVCLPWFPEINGGTVEDSSLLH